ncbi:MAG: sigma 54-interacting transcriptional regulator [Alicyclobacillus sp.]|nr:sigma 54-interacting transcriptional regulator [Alicyclobacillus sp.]MCL6516757.1 sigma 54-interacting transcriptional regulator [Alicyclobacillus sp.]
MAQVLDQLDEGIHVIDGMGRTVFYNRKMALMEQMRPEDVIGQPVEAVFRFPEGESTLLRAVREGRATHNVRQTYFNNRGMRITTINHTVPLRAGDKVVGAVEIARDVTRVERLQEQIAAGVGARYTFDAILHQSDRMREVLEQARRAARTQSSVLIVGETGTGKELLAQAIHLASPRAKGPFVAQNCAALPEGLMEGLLFGTVKGAFTGAIDRPGLFEQADGGTLLLDELNALAPALQAKLLRVLQERTVRRLGDGRERAVDVRIIATMNVDPLAALSSGHLRRDLFHRLSVVVLVLPPLRERMEDLPMLVRAFIDQFNRRFGLSVEGVAPGLMRVLTRYHWPGNVRELEHTVEGAMNLVQDERWLEVRHLPVYLRRRFEAGVGDAGVVSSAAGVADAARAPDATVAGAGAVEAGVVEAGAVEARKPGAGSAAAGVTETAGSTVAGVTGADAGAAAGVTGADGGAAPARGRLRDKLNGFERAVLEQALTESGGNISEAARRLGTSRQNLQYHLRKHGLRPRG